MSWLLQTFWTSPCHIPTKYEGDQSYTLLWVPRTKAVRDEGAWGSHFHEFREGFPGPPGGTRIGEAWRISRFLLPVPPSFLHLSINPDLGTTPGCPTVAVGFFPLIPQNISLRQQHHWGRADPNFTSRYVIAWTVAGGPGLSVGSLSRSWERRLIPRLPHGGW